MKINKKIVKILISLGLILMSRTLIQKSSLALESTEQKIYAKDRDKVAAIYKKEEQKKKKETQKELEKSIQAIEDKMIKNVAEADSYIQNKGKTIEKIASTLGIDMYTIPDKTAQTYNNYEKVKDYKGDDFEQVDEIEWLSLVRRYNTSESPFDFEKLGDIGDKKIDELKKREYGLVQDSMEVRTVIPKSSLDSNESHPTVRFIYEYLKLTNSKLTYDSFIKKINKELKQLEEHFVSTDTKQESELKELNLNLSYWDSGIEIKFSKSGSRFVKEVDPVTDYELVFDSEIDRDRYFKTLRNTFYEWRDQNEERSSLFHDNMNGWGEKSLFFIGGDVDSSVDDASKEERKQIAIESYTKSLEMMYDFISEYVYDGSFPVSKDIFCSRLINSALKSSEDNDYQEEVFPGISAIGTLTEYFSNTVSDIRVYFNFPTRIK